MRSCCWLKDGCPSRTAVCLSCGPDDDGCPVYRWFRDKMTIRAQWSEDTGHWIQGERNGTDPHSRVTGEMIDTYRCTWCGFYQYWRTPYCPNCGAKMEGKVKLDVEGNDS